LAFAAAGAASTKAIAAMISFFFITHSVKHWFNDTRITKVRRAYERRYFHCATAELPEMRSQI
jgi:hypothetical protein